VDLEGKGDAPLAPSVVGIAAGTPAQGPVAVALIAPIDGRLVEPTPALRPEALGFARNAPLPPAFSPPITQREASVEPSAPHETAELTAPPQPSAVAGTAGPLQSAPLPVPRPAELRALRPPEASRTAAAAAPATRSAAAAGAADNRSFVEKLFGLKPSSPPESALGYASLDSTGSIAPTSRFSPGLSPSPTAGTAVYDITARVVTLPNGERLEAHSGLGDKLDDPRFVHLRMRGATPPGTYDLTEREKLFHGVRAIRLNPVGGSAAIYGRDGILAHTYMLGPNGDSNGCVSIRNYDRFLQAYLRGEVKRLVVVTGRGQDVLPRIVNRRTGRAT
jgi:Protein of unknown function (DUF2778)